MEIDTKWYEYSLSLAQNVVNLAECFNSESLNQNLIYAVEYLGSKKKYLNVEIFEAATALIEEFSIDKDLLNDAKNAQHVKTVGRMLGGYI